MNLKIVYPIMNLILFFNAWNMKDFCILPSKLKYWYHNMSYHRLPVCIEESNFLGQKVKFIRTLPSKLK